MKNFLKYSLITGGIVVVLIVAAILVVPMVVNVEDYKPRLEQLVTEKTGYPLTLGGQISLSLFPWVGLNLSDLSLGNPKGFTNKDFITIKEFQARLKLIPLLSKHIEINRFIVEQPEIYLEKNKNGTWNWQNPSQAAAPGQKPKSKPRGAATGEIQNKAPTTAPPQHQEDFAIKSLVVGTFEISNGRLNLVDQTTNTSRSLSDINLTLEDVSLDKQIKLELKAALENKPLSVEGLVGPLGPKPGQSDLDIDLSISAFDLLTAQAGGTLRGLQSQPSYDFNLNIAPFNLKQFLSEIPVPVTIKTTDASALSLVGLRAAVNGDSSHIDIKDMEVSLDDTTINMDLKAREFSRPNLALTASIDAIDLDRYLPPASVNPAPAAGDSTAEKKSKADASNGSPPSSHPGKTSSGEVTETGPAGSPSSSGQNEPNGIDYTPLRKLVMDASLNIAKLHVHGGEVENLQLKLTGKDGIFNLDSLDLELYQGKLTSKGVVNIQKNSPATSLTADLKGVQVGPLLLDFAQKDTLEGKLQADFNLSLQGDRPDTIKQSLSGKGNLLFQDGAIIGLDLAQLARNIKSGFTLEEQGERPKTDFAELNVPFTITNGLLNTPEAVLKSPFIRVTAQGNANLVSETLDLRVNPKLVGSIKGQGDQEEHSGITVPILVGGTFSQPEFSPDLEALAKDQLMNKTELSEIIKTGEVTPERKEQLKEEVNKAKSLLKGLFGN